ncbi:MAG: efflux RND transporter periplasmic adaptor subunit [Gammaproteobacteria bacterium]|nr:efflux RND transporter periplasmic adaptor subunit [Gammaproteobacteria bacterium]
MATALMLTVPLAVVAETLPELDCMIEPYVIVDVGSPEHGIVKAIEVDRSDTVSKNDILVKLEAGEQTAAVRKARARANMQADIKAREAALGFAERKQQRMRDLYASEAISSHQRDEVETELKMAQMQLRQAKDSRDLARIELERAQGDLARRTIRSPISGIIVERFVAPGEYVNEKPLLRVAQMHPLRIEAIAPATMFGKIAPGMRAKVTAETHDGNGYVAEVAVVDRLIDAASGTFGIRLELPNSDYTIPSGLNCRLQIDQRTRVSAVSTPKTAAVKPATPKAAAAKTAAKKPAPAKAVAAKPARTQKAAASVSENTNSCQTLGPFVDEKQLDALLTALGDDSSEVQRRVDSRVLEKGFFVLTETKNSIDEAKSYGVSLKERGVNDLAVLTRPPHKGRLSLGLFKTRANAQAHQLKMAALRINTEVLPRIIRTRQFWVDLKLSANALERSLWKQLAPQADIADCSTSDYVIAGSRKSN